MSKYPAPTREHHDDFCTFEKWQLVRGATGKPVTHHRTYELSLWDGRILRTRISRPVDQTTYGKTVWSHILKQQLEVTSDVFWECALHRALPDRGAAVSKAPKKALPLYMYRELTNLGVKDEVIQTLDAASAAQLIAEKYREQQ